LSSTVSDLAALLAGVERPGDFYTAGTEEIFSPRVEVDGVGPVALPLLQVQAQALMAAAERAPYGRGEETVYDEKVRRTWQIEAGRVRIGGRHWAQSLNAMVASAAEGLGVTGPVQAELYKLLAYGEGDFFISHRDTEKSAGMFGTLVVVLPSIYTGGELVVRHQGREAKLDMRREDPSEAAFAAFYADCLHEVLPITSGCRLTLIYNLVRKAGALPVPPDYRTEQDRAAGLLRQWAGAAGTPEAGFPEKIVYPLQHAYTPAELSFEALKGVDAAVASVLAAAAPSAACELHLALLTIEESGSAEHTGYYGSRWGRHSEEDTDQFEVIEVTDHSATLSNWVRADGAPCALAAIPFKEEEISPPEALEDLEPDEEHFQEATGNEGASFDRTYRRAALTLWPAARRLAVLNQGGLKLTLPYLAGLEASWEAAGAEAGTAPWHEADELLGLMITSWPAGRGYPRRDESESPEAAVLGLLTRFKNAPLIEAFLAGVSAGGAFGGGDSESIVHAAQILPSGKAAELIERIIAANTARDLSACGRLLAQSAGRIAPLTGAGRILVEALPGDLAKAPEATLWYRRPRSPGPGFVSGLVGALDRIDETLSARAVSHMLAWPETYSFDDVLVPAILAIFVQPEGRGTAAALRLRDACAGHLKARIALPLEPPADWKRDGVTSCDCQHCHDLNAFLADPGRQTWTFKAAEPKRRHLEDAIRRGRCDLDLKTEKRGSPHGLVCTKNQASFQRRTQQRKLDLEYLAQLSTS
jgi:predicted 2-oxoglutarate/Fe(II)-dependent dioxygenase YbiX